MKSSDTDTREDLWRSTDDSRCQTACSMHQTVLLGNSPMEKRRVRQAASAVADTHVTQEGASNPEVVATEPIGTTNRFPDQEGLIQ